MDKLVLLDSNSLINRAFYALPYMSDKNGQPTHAVYGFVSMLIRIIKELKPTHMVAAFDLPAPTFRHEKYEGYKATRKPMPDELGSQIPILKDLLRTMDITIAEYPGYEADDIIGTLAKKTPFDTVVVSGDKDTLQLVSDTTRVWLTRKGISNVQEYDPISLSAEGLNAEMIIDLKALMGDVSDNIPGISGIGEKTAMSLLTEYRSLDGIYRHIDEVKGKLKEKLIDGKEIAHLSRELATIDCDAPIECGCDTFIFRYPFKTKVKDYMTELGFKSLLPRLDFDESVEKVVTKASAVHIEKINDLTALNKKILKAKLMSIHLDGDFHIACDKDTEYIISPSEDLFGNFSFDQIVETLKDSLMSQEVKKIAFDYKSLKHRLNGRIMGLWQDLMIKYHLANGGVNSEKVRDILDTYGMNGEFIAIEIIKISEDLERRLNDTGTSDLYYNIEIPLIPVLYDMEDTGFKMDKNVLNELSEKYYGELNTLTEQIYASTGKQFNINSSRQLQEVLFNNLNLPTLKKIKTGFSLSSDVLMKMREMHPVIDLIRKFRHISKLLSTYIEGFKYQIDGDSRVHTVFKQANTATGRLSSTEPNLQNLPIKDDIGKEIRKMFVASDGNILVCADYSQIELRLLAHMTSDEKLINSYINGEDIHRRTASEIFKIPFNEVTSEMRSKAKAVNFGIIYGISSFGLSENADISVKEAKDYIDRYFNTYPRVKEYMNRNVEIAKSTGKINSITGRQRSIPELLSDNYNIRSAGERIAMNMPLQGSAADIIKIAMINVYKTLKKEGLISKLVLQIHDELVIDAPLDEAERVKEIIKEEMEAAVALKVPLIAEVSTGVNLYEAK